MKNLIVGIVAGLFAAGCGSPPDASEHPQTKPSANEIIDMNIRMMRAEQEQINAYIAEQNWSMTESGTGLRMEWMRDSLGAIKPATGNVVSIIWRGTPIDRASEGFIITDTLQMRVDRDDQISALHEAVKSMNIGDKLRLVVPSHLGYGVHGRGAEIPSRSALLCEVELLAINP